MAGYSSLKNSYILVRGVQIPIKFKPEYISEGKTANYSSTDIYGRSSPLLGYSNSGARTVSVNILFYVDGVNYKNFGEVDTYIRLLKSTVYPAYGNPQIYPPEPVFLCIENTLKIYGVVTSVTVEVYQESAWDINKGKPYGRNVELEITEVRQIPLSYEEVKAGKDEQSS